jgi:hypothetical protein
MPMTDMLYLNPTEIDLGKSEPGMPRWPFGTMAIGDCYSVADAREHDNATCSYKYYAKKLGYKYKRRTVGKHLWIWRTE